MEGEFVIPFESDGNVGKDYEFSGKISEASINLTEEFLTKKEPSTDTWGVCFVLKTHKIENINI